VEKLFIDITEFTDKLATQIIGYLETLESDAYKDSRTRYIVNIEFLGDKVPICLQKDFQFWADDEFIVLGDILQEAEVLPDRKMRYYFSAKSHAITRLKKHLRKEQKRNTISVQPISDVSTGGKPCKLTPDIVKQIQEALPSQPWPTAIHKVVASKLGLSNSAVSSAINLLIDEGVFHDQRDGVIIE
jgi:hypothetical protein